MQTKSPSSDYVVDALADADIPQWASMLIGDGFELPDEQGVTGDRIPPREIVEQVIGDMVAIRSLRRYVVRVEGAMVAGASMRMDDRVAQFTGSSDHPALWTPRPTDSIDPRAARRCGGVWLRCRRGHDGPRLEIPGEHARNRVSICCIVACYWFAPPVRQYRHLRIAQPSRCPPCCGLLPPSIRRW